MKIYTLSYSWNDADYTCQVTNLGVFKSFEDAQDAMMEAVQDFRETDERAQDDDYWMVSPTSAYYDDCNENEKLYKIEERDLI